MKNELESLLESENEDFQIGFNFCLSTFFLNTYLPFTQSLINQLKINYSYSHDIMLQHIEESYDALQEYLQDMIISPNNESDISEASVKYNFPAVNADDFFDRLASLQTDVLKINHKQLFENKIHSVVLKNLNKDMNKVDESITPTRSLMSSNFVIPDELKSTTRHKKLSMKTTNNVYDNDKENNDTQKSLVNLIEESFGNI